MINIIIVDNHKTVIDNIKTIITRNSKIRTVAEAYDGYECLSVVNKNNPDIVILDMDMPNLDGMQTLQIMRQQNMTQKVIMISDKEEIEDVIKAMDLGADGFILKTSLKQELLDAIISVSNDETYVQSKLNDELNAKLAQRDSVNVKLENLTKREIEILKLVAAGMLNKEIASTLNISERTVKNHIYSIFKKIDVTDRTHAAVYAIKNNLIDIK